MIFAVAAALVRLAMARGGLAPWWRYWIPQAAAFALAIGREPFPFFLILFAIPTLLVGIEAHKGRSSRLAFLLFASSDALLSLAFTAHFSATGSWELPSPGHFGPGAGIAAAAALARLGGMHGRFTDLPPATVSWWQGVYLAWFVCGSGAATLLTGAALLGVLAIRQSAHHLPGAGFAAGGAAAAMLGGLGAGTEPALAAGLAGSAFALGRRSLPVWVFALLPLSAGSSINVTLPGIPSAVAAAAFAALVAGISTTLPSERARSGGGLIALLAAGFGLYTARRYVGWDWVAYGLGAAVILTYLARPVSFLSQASREETHEPLESYLAESEATFYVPILATAWATVAIAGILSVRLLITGASTGFIQ